MVCTKNQKRKPATYSGLEEDEEQAVLLSDPEKKFWHPEHL